MPHVIVKLWPGKSEKQKQELADKITRAVKDTLHRAKPDTIYKKPGYDAV